MLYSLILLYMSFVCHSYVIHMYSYDTRMSFVCTRMSSASHSYVFVCHPYVTCMYSYVIPMPLVFTRMYSYVVRMSIVCGFTMNQIHQLSNIYLQVYYKINEIAQHLTILLLDHLP